MLTNLVEYFNLIILDDRVGGIDGGKFTSIGLQGT